MSTDLFSDFDSVPAKQWKQRIQVDLKGADYNDSLVWKSSDGVNVKPFYHSDDATNAIKLNSACGWNICEQIYVASVEKSNKRAKEVLSKGAESLWFIVPSEEIDFELLFQDLPLSDIPVYLDCKFLSLKAFSVLTSFLKGRQHRVFLLSDIIGKLARTGNWFHNLNEDHRILDEILASREEFSSVLSVNTSLYQNAGASIPQQLAYGLAHANEYLNHLSSASAQDKNKELTLVFEVAIGSNYFFEIAKIRALRLLYSSIAREYGFNEDIHVLASPSKRNKTLYDFNVNLLRTTTECMSAVLGGADSIANLPYDVVYHKTNEFGSRIGRNQLLILKHESYFEKVANPAEGSYYIESLTQEFAEKALVIFKEIEKGGGFLKQLKAGTIQKKIIESGKKEQEEFDKEQLVLVGTNIYTNPLDRMKEELELYPFLKKNVQKTLLPPILEIRLAEKLEKERLQAEEQ